jgi:YggT family protein
MGVFLIPAIHVLVILLGIYKWVLICAAILSWLIAFGVINTYNRNMAMIGDFLYRITDPALRPIRRFIPNLGGIDISPIILLLIIWFIQAELENLEFVLMGF